VFTLQRRTIWRALRDRTDHPTVADVFDAVGGDASGISRTTVYRTLEAFVSANLVRCVGHLGSAVRYDPRTSHHHHLVCEQCGAVTDVEDSALEPEGGLAPLGLGEEALGGFQVREFSVLIRGRCSTCRSTAAGPPDSSRPA